MKHFCIQFIIILLILQGCSPTDKGMDINSDNVITFDMTDILRYYSDSLPFDDINYIILETKENCLIGEIDKLVIRNDRIHILDSRFAKAVFIFDIDGKFLYQIGNKGNGPLECINLTYFDLDKSGNIYLFDQGGKKILKFNSEGTFIEKYRFPFYASNFMVINEDLFVFNMGNHIEYEGSKNEGLGDYLLQYWIPSKNKVIKSFVPYQGKIIETYGGNGNKFHRSDSTIYYTPTFKDDIYLIDDQSIREVYSYDFANKRISKDQIERMESNDILSQIKTGKLGAYINNFYENKTHIAFTFFDSGDEYISVYSKLSGNIKVSKTNIPLTSKLKSNFIGKLSLCAVDNKYFVNIIEGSLLTSLITGARMNSDFIRKKWSHLKEYKMLQDMDEESNPMLILYSFKKF